MDETTIYESQGVKVTNLRAVVGSKTYSMSNITSVSTSTKESACVPLVAILFGSLLLLAGVASLLLGSSLSGVLPWFILGGLSVGGGILVHRARSATYVVRLGSASGETDALTSANKAEIDAIVAALNEAIVKKG